MSQFSGITHYIRSQDWLKPIRNAGWLSIGRAVQGIVSLGTLALSTRILGIEGFGVLVLIHTLALAVAQLSRFQSWQAVARYGADAMAKNDPVFFSRILNFSIWLDFLGVLIAAGMIYFGADFLLPVLGVPADLVDAAKIYAVVAVILINGGYTALGVMRLLDRFKGLAVQTVIEPLVRFGGVCVLYFASADIAVFLGIWAAALCLSKAVLIQQALVAMREHGLWQGVSLSPQNLRAPVDGMWGFVWGTHILSTIRMGQSHMPLLIVGAVLGPAAAGLFRVARQLADILVKPNRKLLEPALFPELAKLSANDALKARRKMVYRLSALVGGLAVAVFVILAFCGKTLLSLLAGQQAAEAYQLMIWLAGAGVLGLIVFPLDPLLVTAGKLRVLIFSQCAALLIYAGSMWGMMALYGLNGAGMATVLFHTVLIFLLMAPAQSVIHARTSG